MANFLRTMLYGIKFKFKMSADFGDARKPDNDDFDWSRFNRLLPAGLVSFPRLYFGQLFATGPRPEQLPFGRRPHTCPCYQNHFAVLYAACPFDVPEVGFSDLSAN